MCLYRFRCCFKKLAGMCSTPAARQLNNVGPTMSSIVKRTDMAVSCQNQPGKNSKELPDERQSPRLSRFRNNFIIQIATLIYFLRASNMPFEQRATFILERHLSVQESLKPRNAAVERRAKPRANEALPARVWGVEELSNINLFSYLIKLSHATRC